MYNAKHALSGAALQQLQKPLYALAKRQGIWIAAALVLGFSSIGIATKSHADEATGLQYSAIAANAAPAAARKTAQFCPAGLGAVYATWNAPSSTSGTGVFASGGNAPAVPNYSWTITGDLSSNSVDSSETFSGANTFETIYGQADTQSNLNPRVQGNSHGQGSPIEKSITMTMTFDSPTPAAGLGFAIIDIDSEQVEFRAKDANGNPVPTAVVASWFVEAFDPNGGTGGTSLPVWQPSYPALIGPLTGRTVWQDNSLGSLGDDEASGGWFQPDIPLSEISLVMEPVDSTNTTHSIHVYMASCLEQRDYSDAPLTGTNYNAASHAIRPGNYLGQNATAEGGPYNSANANGDSDDGISIPILTQGQSDTITATVAGPGGYLQGWIDWNGDGDWNDAGERIATNLQDSDNDGSISIPVTPPANAALSGTVARFRWSTAFGLDADDNAPDGEVEDYAFAVQPSGGGGLFCPAGFAPANGSGNAVTVIVAAKDSSRALGPIEASGTSAKNFSAKVESGDRVLTLRLGNVVPGNASVIFSLARDDNDGEIIVEGSLNSASGYTQIGSFSGGTRDRLGRVSYFAPAGGMEYVRFSYVDGKTWVDGLECSNVCVNAPAKLTIEKTMSVWDPMGENLFSVPGNDVMYSITVSNAGSGSADAGSVQLIDRLPAQLEFWNGDVDAGGPDTHPVGFTQSSGANLTFDYSTDVRYGTGNSPPANFAACTTIAPDNSYRSDIKYICINPKGAITSGNPDPTFSIKYRTRIK